MTSFRRMFVGAGALVLLIGLACRLVSPPRRLFPFTEVVLRPGMSVSARTQLGSVTIAAGRGTRRAYSGPGWSQRLHLIARRHRWYGSLGLYDGAVYGPSGPLVVEEGQVHVLTRVDALRWLTLLAGNDSTVYTRDGLVCAVAADQAPGVHPRIIELWQIYVGGKKPHDLPLARDDAFHVVGGATPEAAEPHVVSGGGVPEMSGPRAAALHFGDPSLSPAPPPR